MFPLVRVVLPASKSAIEVVHVCRSRQLSLVCFVRGGVSVGGVGVVVVVVFVVAGCEVGVVAGVICVVNVHGVFGSRSGCHHGCLC